MEKGKKIKITEMNLFQQRKYQTLRVGVQATTAPFSKMKLAATKSFTEFEPIPECNYTNSSRDRERFNKIVSVKRLFFDLAGRFRRRLDVVVQFHWTKF